MLLIIPLLSLCVFTAQGAVMPKSQTAVEYTIYIECLFAKPYCFLISFYDRSVSTTKEMFKLPLHCTFTHDVNYNTTVTFTELDGHLDTLFEPELHFYHNCTNKKNDVVGKTIAHLERVDPKNKKITVERVVSLIEINYLDHIVAPANLTADEKNFIDGKIVSFDYSKKSKYFTNFDADEENDGDNDSDNDD
ncbi:hypothetical protein CRE_29143 [Caenorhabditis remanei]|uniref:Uncharacterized protein n=1 Tax=Caenorhabditis remanei TaxID=31234 RepID=E3N4L0_CAERE|nr:hypothetical protein CRE_29143 [Caenorhabditis remanei]